MKARALIANATFGPDDIKILTQAFDEAWGQIAPDVSDRPQAIEAARERLANIILGLAKTATQFDAGLIRDEAVRLIHANLTKLRR